MSPAPGVIAKFALLMSKKTLSLALTLILAAPVLTLGRNTAAEPSLGVPATSSVGKV